MLRRLELLLRLDEVLAAEPRRIEAPRRAEALADRALGREVLAPVEATPSERPLLEAWLRAVAPKGDRARAVAAVTRRGLWIAAGLGGGLGVMVFVLAVGVLGAGRPVGVLPFLLMTVGAPALFWIATCFVLPRLGPARRRGWISLLFEAALHRLARAARTLAGDGRAADALEAAGDAAPSAYAGLLRPGGLLAAVRDHLLFFMTQVFAVTLTAGLLVAFGVALFLVDLQFGWQATLGEGTVIEVVRIASLPFAWALPEIVPSVEAIAATRWVPVPGAWAVPADEAVSAARAWWPFLLACLVAWVAIPRLVLLLAAYGLLRRRIDATLRGAESLRVLVRRMREPLVEVGLEPGGDDGGAGGTPGGGAAGGAGSGGPAPGGAASGGPAPGGAASSDGDAPRPAGEDVPYAAAALKRVAVIEWAMDEALPEAALHDLAGIEETTQIVGAGRAGHGPSEDAPTLEAIAGAGPLDAVCVVCEHFELPRRAARRFLERLRARLGPSTPILVVLVSLGKGDDSSIDPGALDLWRETLMKHRDPLLMAVALGGMDAQKGAGGTAR